MSCPPGEIRVRSYCRSKPGRKKRRIRVIRKKASASKPASPHARKRRRRKKPKAKPKKASENIRNLLRLRF